MELRHLKYFVTVADEGSITKAADRLLMAQPPLSRQIQALEEELGVTLFSRGKGRQTLLTEEGRVFYPYAKRVLELTYESIKAVRTAFSAGDGSSGAPGSKVEAASGRDAAGGEAALLRLRAEKLRAALDQFLKEDLS